MTAAHEAIEQKSEVIDPSPVAAAFKQPTA
jgi:hypothetical protein